MLLILGTGFLLVWQPLTHVIPLKISDAAFVLAFCAWFLGAFHARKLQGLQELQYMRPGLLLVLGILLSSILLATLIGFYKYDLPMTRNGFVLLARLLLCMSIFLLVLAMSQTSGGFKAAICFAFLSPTVLLLVLMIPSVASAMRNFADGRFRGLTENPNTAAAGLIMALSFGYVLAIFEFQSARRLARGLIHLFMCAGMLALILWTQSKAYIFAAAVPLVLGPILVSSWLTLPKLKVVVKYGVALALLLPVALMLFTPGPPLANQLLARVLPSKVVPRSLQGIVSTLVVENLTNPTEQVRVITVRYYLHVLSANYFGLGLNYDRKFLAYVPRFGEYHGVNTILDIPVYGGVGAVFSLCLFLLMITRNVRRRLIMPPTEDTIYVIGAATALAALWTAAVGLGSPLFGYHFWVLAAVALT